jgi:ABC-2 type transport system permease protein
MNQEKPVFYSKGGVYLSDIHQTNFRRTLSDILSGLKNYRIWYLMSTKEVRNRYNRSKLGQFWHTMTMGIMLVGIGLVYAQLFNIPVKEYMVYLSITFPVWSLVSGLVNDGSATFIASSRYITEIPLPYTTYIYASISRNFVIFLHNILVVPIAFIIFGHPVDWHILILLLTLPIVLINGVFIHIILGFLCARFRDFQHIIGSIMQIMFFVTPIVFKPESVQGRMEVLQQYNIIGSFIGLIREPIRGMVPSTHDLTAVLIFTICAMALSLIIYSIYRKKLVYWL